MWPAGVYAGRCFEEKQNVLWEIHVALDNEWFYVRMLFLIIII
jgi:hypothetical protein